MELSLIKFMARSPHVDADRDVIFTLGLGPCGRYVDKLESQIDFHGVTITQTSYQEDFGHLFETWCTLQTNWLREYRLIHGLHDEGVGFDNKAHMSLTEDGLRELHTKANEYADKVRRLQEQREIKTFFYKLEDVRGRIVAIKK